MVEIIQPSKMALDGLIEVLGRAQVEAALRTSRGGQPAWEAAAILEDLRAKEPGDPEVGLALASVQSALGRPPPWLGRLSSC